MNENEIVVENVLEEVVESIKRLKQRKTVFGGFDKEYVLQAVQEICGIYEKKIEALISENKEKLDLLNGEISSLKLQNGVLSRKITTEPAVIEKANKAITDANARIESANAYITKLLALYDEAEAKIKEQEAIINQLSSGAAPVQVTTPVQENVRVETAAPIIAAAPTEAAAPVKVETPVKAAAPVEVPAPVKATVPVQEAVPVQTSIGAQANCILPQNSPYLPNYMYPQNYPYSPNFGMPVNYGFAPNFGYQPFYAQELNRREVLIENQDVVVEAKSTANKIVSGAKDDAEKALRQAKEEADKTLKLAQKEAERLRELARNEAETIIRDRRIEIRAEERLHQEAIDDLKSRYSKYGEFFSKMLNEVNKIEGDIAP